MSENTVTFYVFQTHPTHAHSHFRSPTIVTHSSIYRETTRHHKSGNFVNAPTQFKGNYERKSGQKLVYVGRTNTSMLTDMAYSGGLTISLYALIWHVAVDIPLAVSQAFTAWRALGRVNFTQVTQIHTKIERLMSSMSILDAV